MHRLVESAAVRLRGLASQLFDPSDRLRRFVSSDDLFQEFAIKLPRSLEKQKPTSSRAVVALSAKMMRHTLIDFARHLFGNDTAWGNLQQKDDSKPFLVPDPQESPSRASQLNEARICLLEEVEKLGELEKEVFDLHFIEGLPQNEVAALTGISQGQVSKTWMGVKATLANRVQTIL
ncbi:MAG: sigma-70 family RNA polymerase sigma factor, partial [Planctomycetota bacterium]